MKKILLLAVMAVLLPLVLESCNKEDVIKEKEIMCGGYVALSSSSTYGRAGTVFLFFSANNGEEYETVSHNFDGNILEYQKITDEIFDLLKERKMKLKDGTVKEALYRVYSSAEEYEILHIPIARYCIVAIYGDDTWGYKWGYSTKYAVKYFDLNNGTLMDIFTVVFPYDLSRYGEIPWIKQDQGFPFDF